MQRRPLPRRSSTAKSVRLKAKRRPGGRLFIWRKGLPVPWAARDHSAGVRHLCPSARSLPSSRPTFAAGDGIPHDCAISCRLSARDDGHGSARDTNAPVAQLPRPQDVQRGPRIRLSSPVRVCDVLITDQPHASSDHVASYSPIEITHGRSALSSATYLRWR